MTRLVYSHTNLASFNLCPRQFRHRYILKDVPREESEAMRWGSLVHKALENRVRSGDALPESMQPYEVFAGAIARHHNRKCEHKMGMTSAGQPTAFFGADCWFRGVADVVVLSDANTALLLDYKTGKVREDPTELEEHAMLLKAAMPTLESIKGAYVWLKEHRMGEIHKLDPERTLETTRRVVSRIEEQLEKDLFPPHENPLCNYCSVESCEFRGKWRR